MRLRCLLKIISSSTDQVLDSLDLDPDDWTVVTQALVDRAATGPDGSAATLAASVVSVRRRVH